MPTAPREPEGAQRVVREWGECKAGSILTGRHGQWQRIAVVVAAVVLRASVGCPWPVCLDVCLPDCRILWFTVFCHAREYVQHVCGCPWTLMPIWTHGKLMMG